MILMSPNRHDRRSPLANRLNLARADIPEAKCSVIGTDTRQLLLGEKESDRTDSVKVATAICAKTLSDVPHRQIVLSPEPEAR